MLLDATTRVDGHDISSFSAKAEQVTLIRKQVPALAAIMVPIQEMWSGNGWAAYVMPFVEGEPLVNVLTRPEPTGWPQLQHIVEHLLTHGYGPSSKPAPADWAHRHHLVVCLVNG